MTGCYFHFGQNVWRQLQGVGKTSEYINNEQFAMKVKSLMALAFIPETDVTNVFDKLINDPDFQEIDFLTDYFEDNYIGRQRRGRLPK